MNKQTYPIPEGCKAITIETIDNQIITTFEPAQAQPEFKRGDVIYCEDKDGFSWVFILKEKTIRKYNPYNYFCVVTSIGEIATDDRCRHPERVFRHATPEEAQRLWDALAKEGKKWNPETMEVEEIKKERWRAKQSENYWMINSEFEIKETRDTYGVFDTLQYYSGVYFKTEEQAQRAVDKLKQTLADFWKEELK